MDKIIDWMNEVAKLKVHYNCEYEESDLIQLINKCKKNGKAHDDIFEVKKSRTGKCITIEANLNKVYRIGWKQIGAKKRKPFEIEENKGQGLCPICGKSDGYIHHHLYNGHCTNCGYTRPSDKIIIELWNQKKTLQQMIFLLDEPNANYIKIRLRKYGLYEKIGYVRERVMDDNDRFVYAWENINEKKFPIMENNAETNFDSK